jgi:hypothetical protein
MKKSMLYLLPMLIFLGACSEPIQPKLVNEMSTFREYEVHYEYQTEQWDDPEILTTPRLQFTWVKPGDERHQVGIWTMKFDGTDLRELVTPKELMPEHLMQGILRPDVPLVRSPNNRYIPYAVSHAGQYERRILDLKTKEVTVIVDGGGQPRFQWFKGSRFLTFSGPSPLMQYDLENKTLTDIGERFTKSGYLRKVQSFDNGNQIIDMQDEMSIFYDFDTGEKLKQFSNTDGVLTLDNKFWIKRVSGHNTNLAHLDDANRVAYKLPKGLAGSNLTGISAGGYIFSAHIRKAKINDDKVTIYSLPGDVEGENLSIYNYKKFIAH